MPDDHPQPDDDRPDPGVRRRLGTSREYILGRLKREGLTQWIEPIESGRLSAYAVACELGWAKRAATLSGESSGQAKRRRVALELAGKPTSSVTQDPLSSEREWFLRFGPDERQDDPFSSIEEAREAWLANRDRLLANHAPGRRCWAWHEFEAPPDLPYRYDSECSVLYQAGLLDQAEARELEVWWRQEFERAEQFDPAARRAHHKWADIPKTLLREWKRKRRRRGKTVREPEAAVGQPPPAV
jgi:hypothetical protein